MFYAFEVDKNENRWYFAYILILMMIMITYMNRLRVLLVMVMVMSTGICLDYQRQLECEFTLEYIIKLVKDDRVSDFHDNQLKRCTESKCCLCGLQFKNSTFSAIHIAIHHHKELKHSEEIAILFDDAVPSNQRQQFCHHYLKPMNLTAQNQEDVCIIISEGYYKPKMFLVVIKYILYVVVALISLIYYSDISRPRK